MYIHGLLALILFFMGACWGSFLHCLSDRLINQESLVRRSFCFHCGSVIAWYDLIPFVSWFLLLGRCRRCGCSISILFPAIELFAGVVCLLSWWYISPYYYLYYLICFSSLVMVMCSDFQYLLIHQYNTLCIIPFLFLYSGIADAPISLAASIVGAFLGYAALWFVYTVHYMLTGRQGLGFGDMDLLAFIGAFVGPLLCWYALLLASIMGIIGGGIQAVLQEKSACRNITALEVPFGFYLALAAFIIVFMSYVVDITALWC